MIRWRVWQSGTDRSTGADYTARSAMRAAIAWVQVKKHETGAKGPFRLVVEHVSSGVRAIYTVWDGP